MTPAPIIPPMGDLGSSYGQRWRMLRSGRVASRSGSFQFRNRALDNREVARLLSVRAVLVMRLG